MKKGLLLVGTLVCAAAVAIAFAGVSSAKTERSGAGSLTGAGSSFVFPLVSKWIPALGSAYGIQVNYSPVGSGAGIAAITARTVDFGASDAPLSSDQFNACNGCVQIPWALSATSIIYNVPGAPAGLKLTPAVIAQIWLGTITKWSSPAIRKLNPGASLPDLKITPAYRSDNSGTTYNFSDYLSSVSSQWKSQYGTGVAVNWPNGTGARGSAGVASTVSQTPGGIGYVDVAYALKNHLKFFSMKNRSGKYATPGLKGILAAASSDQKPDATNALSIVNPPKKFALAYPISTYTYVIVPTSSQKAPELRKFLFWAVTKGQTYGPRLLFQPIPKSVLVVAEKTISKIKS